MNVRPTSARKPRFLAALTAVLLGLTGSVALASPSVAAAVVRVASSGQSCAVDGATITWGFKESFRSYISGSIANGEWTVADGATYATPDFGWAEGTGAIDAKSGLVAFPGSVTFTGHGDILNTTVSSPQLQFIDSDTAMLLLDVSGTTQDGASVDEPGVEFVEIELAGVVERTDGSLAVTAAPTTLTAAGSAAFGTYESGEPFDPISFTLPFDADCATPLEAAPTAAASGLAWLWPVSAVVVLLLVAAVIVIVVRRRRAA